MDRFLITDFLKTRKKNLKTALALATLGLMLCHCKNRLPASSPSSIVQVSLSPIQQDIQRSLQKRALAKTYGEWATSGFTPTDVFQNIQDLKRPELWSEVCESLQKLTDAELASFEAEIERRSVADFKGCRAQLLGRIQGFWARAQDAFRRIAPDQRGPASALGADGSRVPWAQRSPLGERVITLSFEDGPHPTRTRRILEALKRENVKAFFFPVGQRAREHAELVKEIRREGHVLGAHGMSEKDLTTAESCTGESEIQESKEALSRIAEDAPIAFFYFPLGSPSAHLEPFLASQKLISFEKAPQPVDTGDWRSFDPKQLFERVTALADAQKRGTFHFHDSLEQTAIILPQWIRELKNKGFRTIIYVP